MLLDQPVSFQLRRLQGPALTARLKQTAIVANRQARVASVLSRPEAGGFFFSYEYAHKCLIEHPSRGTADIATYHKKL